MSTSRKRRHDGSGAWQAILVLGYTLLLMALVVFSIEAYRELERQRMRERELSARVEAAEARIRRAQQTVERLQRDPLALERIAREQLGWVRSSEVVLFLPKADDIGRRTDSRMLSENPLGQ